MPSESSLPTWWINLWIVIGCFAFVLFFGVPVFMSRNLALEYQRFQDCRDHRRADCKPSMVWLLSDWKMSTSTSLLDTDLKRASDNIAAPSAAPLQAQQIDYVATSTVSIRFPADIQNENDSTTKLRAIQVPEGQKIAINVTAPSTVARVEVFVGDIASSDSEKAFPTKPTAVLVKGRSGQFTGSWTYPKEGFHGFAHMEVRTYTSSKGSAEANAKYDHVTYLVAIKK